MSEAPDPGYHDLDRSAGFDEIVASLAHFNDAPYIKEARRVLYRLIRPRPGRRILDAGCGLGVDVAALAPSVQPGGLVVGLDLSARMIELARERCAGLPDVDLRVGNVSDIEFAAGSFDAAFAMRTLQYLDEPVVALRELARVTRPGGRVIVVEGGMSVADLPDAPLSDLVFHRRGGLGVRLPNLMREVGLQRIDVRPAFSAMFGPPDPKVIDYARSAAANAVGEGVVSEDEAASWIESLEAIAARGDWFAAECMFVVSGTVSRR